MPGRPRFVPANEFADLSIIIIGCHGKTHTRTFRRRFHAVFGMNAKMVAVLWKKIALNGSLDTLGPRSLRPIHLLWTLMFLRTCGTEEDHASRAGVCEKTFRKWAWFYVQCIAILDKQLIKWKNRLIGDRGNRCLVTIDGTDFRISEPTPFQKVWYTQKFKSAGLRCELAVCIITGDIVAYNGPFAPKPCPDINIFRFKLKDMLLPGEQVLADKGCAGDLRCCTPCDGQNLHHIKAMSCARARHETVNRMLKRWRCLQGKYRHHRMKHHWIFRAVVSITQLMINCGYRPFDLVDYTYDDPMWLTWMI